MKRRWIKRNKDENTQMTGKLLDKKAYKKNLKKKNLKFILTRNTF